MKVYEVKERRDSGMQATIGSSCMNSPLAAYRKNRRETRKAGSSLALHEVQDVGSKLHINIFIVFTEAIKYMWMKDHTIEEYQLTRHNIDKSVLALVGFFSSTSESMRLSTINS